MFRQTDFGVLPEVDAANRIVIIEEPNMKDIPLAQRLIVALDVEPTPEAIEKHMGRAAARIKVMQLARILQGTSIIIKLNSILRAVGYDLIDDIHQMGLGAFADLKIFDIKATAEIDGKFLAEARPEIVTAACMAGPEALRALQAQLPHTEVLGVTVLTSLSNADTKAMFACSTEDAVLRLARIGQESEISGLISAPSEVDMLIRKGFGAFMTLNTPGIRLLDGSVKGDDQNPERIMTPTKAIRAGADRIVVGRPITQAKDPVKVVQMILDEISAALAVRNAN